MNHTNMRHATKIWLVIWMTLLTPLWAYAQSTVVQGGTGTTSFPGGYLLSGSSALRLTAVPTTTASCTGATSCSPFTVLGSSPVTISTSAGTTYTATFPISIVGSIISFLGLSTSSPGITAGQPLYATDANTIASVASSTFLTSIGGQASGNYLTALTGDVTASGPGSAAATLASVISASSCTSCNLTYDAKGRITVASSGSGGSGSVSAGANGQFGYYTPAGTTIAGSYYAYASTTNGASLFGANAGGQNATTSATDNNTSAFGFMAGNALGSGTSNSLFGYQAGLAITSGSGNTIVGKGGAKSLTTGAGNTCVGSSCLNLLSTSGAGNTAVGNNAGLDITSGGNNVALGISTVSNKATTGSFNVVIGNHLDLLDPTLSNQLNIGNALYGTNLYGNATNISSSPVTNGSIGIGTTSPYAKFSIHANNGDALTTVFAIASSTASATSTLFTILNTGNVGIGTSSPTYALQVVTASADAGDIASFQNTNPNSFSDNVFIDSSGTAKMGIGYGNSGLSGGSAFATSLAYIQTLSTDFQFLGGTGGTPRLTIKVAGNVGIGTTSPWKTFSVVGTAAINGLSAATAGTVIVCIDTATKELKLGGGATTCAPSVISVKKDIESFNGGISELMQIPVDTFYFKENEPQQQIGFIAQSLDAIDVRLTQRINGVLSSIRLDNILALTVKAIQDLKNHDDTQDREIAQLKQEIEQLKKQ